MQELERIHVGMGQAWPGLSQEHLGDWILRFGGGYTSRANSALPVGKPGVPIAEAIKHVKDSYASRGLSPKYQIPLLTHAEIPQRIPAQAERADSFVPGSTIDTGATPVNKELDDALEHADYAWSVPALVQTLPAHVAAGDVQWPAGVSAEWTDTPTQGWKSLASQRFHDNPHALEVTLAHPAKYLTLWNEHEPIGRGRVSAAGEFYDVSDLLVLSRMRGMGLGRQMMTAMTLMGRELGARTGVLQVEADNARAITLYRSLGWQDQGGYHFRTLAD
ncbi:GNAT family N-acetyltransferase [Schaalia hyovaginalis]|uniref:Ribosomal protein S18 acetylase RimI-like enzyme n=1 Tax=Schaalia hyovaginalis TaxID=29316 RepID=A0A923E3D9_9ACTO|nr:GNAT family N-acetyltransferase [Schaalia hyovaginalis]MBB6335184.1 ribosomal protein S18 acetylase RimI-like enzyme [Schaalia hyovaginalis]MDY2668541.1 GNAT family N-acetyltransferase [Schaalia hyovaginalis]